MVLIGFSFLDIDPIGFENFHTSTEFQYLIMNLNY